MGESLSLLKETNMNDNGTDRRWIVIDLDGTLCDCSHRVHLAQAKQWDDFHAGIMDDKPYPEVVEFVKIISPHYNTILCTGRPETYRKDTYTHKKIPQRKKNRKKKNNKVFYFILIYIILSIFYTKKSTPTHSAFIS